MALYAALIVDPVQDYEQSAEVLGVYSTLESAIEDLPRLRALPMVSLSRNRPHSSLEIQEWEGSRHIRSHTYYDHERPVATEDRYPTEAHLKAERDRLAEVKKTLDEYDREEERQDQALHEGSAVSGLADGQTTYHRRRHYSCNQPRDDGSGEPYDVGPDKSKHTAMSNDGMFCRDCWATWEEDGTYSGPL